MVKEVYEETLESVLHQFKSNAETGLRVGELNERLREYGRNVLPQEKKVSVFSIFFRQLKNIILYVLLAASLISFLTHDVIEGVAIFIMIIIILIIGFFMEYKATREMESLKELSPLQALVLRDGQKEQVLASNLFPGDIVFLERGDVVPADCRVMHAVSLRVDESSLTGESSAVNKQTEALTKKTMLAEQSNMVFASSKVVNGHAKCVVVATGKHTEIGKVAKLIATVKEEDSPLQKRLNTLGKQITIFVIVLSAIIFLVGLLKGQHWEQVLLFAVVVSVAGFPESLPAILGIVLSLGMKRMAQHNAVIKRLPVVETLGTCDIICTDKTGTLTQNKMVIENIFTLDSEVDVTGLGFTPDGLFLREDDTIDPKKHKTLQKMLEIGVLCNNASLHFKDDEWHVDGEPTEGAFIVLAKKAGFEKETVHEAFPRLHEHPFDPSRKFMSTVHMTRNKPIVYAKGAPEVILEKSLHYLAEGKVNPLTADVRAAVIAKMNTFADKGLRVMGLAYKEHQGETYEMKHVESNLIFVGLVSMRDPPAEGVKEAIKECQEAGATVVMITGDNKITATSIARELGILKENNAVLTGEELDALDADAFLKIVDAVRVYARTTPEHKLRIVEALQSKGHIVAMTGDGVNDAPALKRADIGISMGKRGTAVAREASDMVIKDDQFPTIVHAIREGRTVYSNIRKFVYYLLSANFSIVLLAFIASLLDLVPPLTPLMILFINLVTSDIPAVGLCFEKTSSLIMKRKPRNPKESILDRYLFLRIGQAIPVVVLGTLALYLWELVGQFGSTEKAQTMAFAAIIVFAVFHAFNAKSFHDSIFSKNKRPNGFLVATTLSSLTLSFLVIYWKPLQHIFNTVPLGIEELLGVLLITSLILFFVEVQKATVQSEIKDQEQLEIYPTRR